MALLEVENLQTHFRTPDGINRAVDGVSFHVDEGETLAIVGESGCGKSVTAMSLMRLIPEPPGKIAGSVRFRGGDLLKLSDREMRAIRGNDISMIFQDLSGYFRHLTTQVESPIVSRDALLGHSCLIAFS